MPAIELTMKDRVVLITGGSRGIGRATALEFARSGSHVAIVARKVSDIDDLVQELRLTGRQALGVITDLSNRADLGHLVGQVTATFGRIDVLVNNAGMVTSNDTAIGLTEADWDRVMDVNLKSLFFLSQEVAQVMKNQGGGSIINMSSISGVRPGPRAAVYSISKAGVVMATKVMALEWAKYGIRVNALAPGLTSSTGIMDLVTKDPQVAGLKLKKIPLGRFADPQDIARSSVFLASDAARHITGIVLSIDGGESL